MANNWIRVEDRLPDDGRMVLTWDGVEQETDQYIAGYGWACGHNGVTHWQPLPEAPDGD